MNKFSGIIGFVTDLQETRPGIWEEGITEKCYYGEILQNSRRFEISGNVNDDITVSNRVSVIGNPYAFENFHMMRYMIFMGAKWKITDVEVKYPRLILTFGGLYNG